LLPHTKEITIGKKNN